MKRAAVLLLAACATGDEQPTPIPDTDLLELAWQESFRPGDLIVAIPGTGGYSALGRFIEEQVDPADAASFFDGRSRAKDVQAMEAAIEAAHRGGITDAQLEAGEIDLAIWGAGITEFESFRYRSVGGLDVTFAVLGGKSICAEGGIFENITNYNADNAAADAGDLYRRTKQWLQADDGAPARRVILASHSWGGAVAEYLTDRFAEFAVANGDWDATLGFTVAGGVPAMVPGFATFGPGFRTVTSTAGEKVVDVRTYEVARPDDPIRTFDPNGNGDGHNYVILIGDDYKGWYGITTDEMVCDGMPGPCERRM